MQQVTLTRFSFAEETTLGRWVIQGYEHVQIFTLELSWLNNANDKSCVPEGVYTVKPHNWDTLPGFNPAMHQKNCYELENVPGRTGVCIHIGNTILDILGCIAVGKSVGRIGGRPAVLSSVAALNELLSILGQGPFQLTITHEAQNDGVISEA